MIYRADGTDESSGRVPWPTPSGRLTGDYSSDEGFTGGASLSGSEDSFPYRINRRLHFFEGVS